MYTSNDHIQAYVQCHSLLADACNFYCDGNYRVARMRVNPKQDPQKVWPIPQSATCHLAMVNADVW